jgi:hypothetical protein
VNRLTAGHRAAIAVAFEAIPERIVSRLRHVDVLTGTDPVFAGLHGFEVMSFGRSYRTTAHASLGRHTADGRTTIVLPTPEEPIIIVHELGHALDEALGEIHEAEPVTWYAATDRLEAFAEAWTVWVAERSGLELGSWRSHYADSRPDPAIAALFEELAA